MQPTELNERLTAHRAELRAVDQRIARLTGAIEDGGAVAPLVAQLQVRQQERERLLGAIAAIEGRRAVTLNREARERRVLAKVEHWRSLLLTTHVADARQALREVLEGPLRFTPEGRSYRFQGEAAADRLVGEVGLPPKVASPETIERDWTTWQIDDVVDVLAA